VVDGHIGPLAPEASSDNDPIKCPFEGLHEVLVETDEMDINLCERSYWEYSIKVIKHIQMPCFSV
jgi:hypothetical protein